MKETVLFLGLLFLQTDPSFEVRIMDDSVQCWSNLRIEYFKIRCSNSSNRTRRFDIIHWINHLHFLDPQHGFRRKLWASTYLSLESYLPTSECCWRGEFVKMRIWNLQSLLVCSIIVWKSSLTRDEWISGWRSWLDLWSWTGVWLSLITCGEVCFDALMDSTLAGKVLKTTPSDLQKRFPIYHAFPKYLAAYRCGSAFPENGLAVRQDFGMVGNRLWSLGSRCRNSARVHPICTVRHLAARVVHGTTPLLASTFSVPTITDGYARLGRVLPYTLDLHRPDCTLSRLFASEHDSLVTQSIATPEPGFPDPHPGSSRCLLRPRVCHHTRDPTVLSRVSCRPAPESWPFSPAFPLPCYPGAPLLPPKHGWLLGKDRWGLSSPYHVAATYPCGQPGSSSLCVSLEVFATPTRRYHGRMLIHPSPLARATSPVERCLHAGSGPSRVRRRLFCASLRYPIPPWPRRLTGNVGLSTAYWFSIFKISRIIHAITFHYVIPESWLWVQV